tara:strand:+ start:4044 stop:4292 length:249 start_codon:yes stop_codon:yes gene_type:complete
MWIQLLGIVYNLNLVTSFTLDYKHQVADFKNSRGDDEQLVIPAIKLKYANGHEEIILYHKHLDSEYVRSDYGRLIHIVGPLH